MTFGIEDQMDFEIELVSLRYEVYAMILMRREQAIWVAKDLPKDERITLRNVDEYIFGLTLLNDWSCTFLTIFPIARSDRVIFVARHVQKDELVPCGALKSVSSLLTLTFY